MRIRHILPVITALSFLAAGCSDSDSPEAAQDVNATFSIGTRTPQPDAEPNELINSWWLAFVDASGTVRKIIDRPVDNGPVDYEEFHFNVSKGSTFDIYAFANITRQELKDAGIDIALNLPLPDLTSAKWNKVGKTGDLVPMTGLLRNVTFNNSANEHFSIEVVRLWAKLCFEFTTDTQKNVTVSNISMTPALTESVTFLPDYASLGSAPKLPGGINCSELNHGMNLLVPASGEKANEKFYLLESTAASHATQRYPITFDIQYADGTKRQISALAHQLQHINRNDNVTIPVLITEWTLDVKVLFYPPIGGYPAVLTESNDREFFARFGSGGKFVIRPTVQSYDGTIVADKDIEITLTTTDPSGILSSLPVRDTTTSEITGEIKSGITGTAYVDMSVKIKTDALTHNIQRRFYIIRQN